MKKRIVIAVLFACFLCACDSSDSDPTARDHAQDLLMDFGTTAARHGWNVRTDIVDFVLKDSIARAGRSYCGYASSMNGRRQIELDTTCLLWTESDLSREVIVFHELGHALLNRAHRDTKLPNGDWRSLMNTGTLLDLYHTPEARFKRDYYLDELFDEYTPVPDWAQVNDRTMAEIPKE